MENLVVKDVYTTDDEDTSSVGAMTLTCEVNGVTISVRTVVLTDGNGNLVTADAFLGKTIDVRGIVDYFKGTYQIKVFSVNDITIHN
jgi:DNA/RNA endonuclease YhcR with UshA esterase domain